MSPETIRIIDTYQKGILKVVDTFFYKTIPRKTTHHKPSIISDAGIGAYRIRPSAYQADRVIRPLQGRLEGVFDTPLRRHLKNRVVLGEHFPIVAR